MQLKGETMDLINILILHDCLLFGIIILLIVVIGDIKKNKMEE